MAKLVVILGFLVSFAAGLAVGARADWSRWTGNGTQPQSEATLGPAPEPRDDDVHTRPVGDDNRRPPHGPPHRGKGRPGRGGPDRGPGGWLAAELGLSREQHRQLDEIWSALADRGRRRDHEGQRHRFRAERDEAVAALIAPERWDEYQQIIEDFAERNAALDRAFRGEFDQAVERTKQILSPEQRAKYEKLLQRHRWGPPRPRDGKPPREAEAATRKSQAPNPKSQTNSNDQKPNDPNGPGPE